MNKYSDSTYSYDIKQNFLVTSFFQFYKTEPDQLYFQNAIFSKIIGDVISHINQVTAGKMQLKK